MVAQSAFSPIATNVDFTQLYDSYVKGREDRRQQRAREKLANLPTGPNGQLDLQAAARDLMEYDPNLATRFMQLDHQQRPKPAAAPASYREFQLRQQNPDYASYLDSQKQPSKPNLINTGGRLYNADTGEWVMPPEGAGVSDYGKSGAVFQGQDGRFYTVQFGSDGSRQILPVETGGQNLTPAKGVQAVGDELINSATGQAVRNVGPNLEAAEAAKTAGRERAQGAAALPKTENALRQYEIQNNIVNENIDLAVKQADGWTTGLTGSVMAQVPGTEAHNLQNTLNTIKANIGFDKLQAMRDASPTGGALGQVSEMENRLLQSVLGALEQSQGREQFLHNLRRLKDTINEYQQLKREAYANDVARFGRANVPNPETGQLPGGAPAAPTGPQVPTSGAPRPQSQAAPQQQNMTARNPQTGQTIVSPDGVNWYNPQTGELVWQAQ